MRKVLVEFEKWLRAHQVRLDGGDASSDSYCYSGGEMMHSEMAFAALWLMLLLGAYHGVNPGMGWLFAVALGMQEQKGRAVAKSLVPIALGHALAIGSVVMIAAFLGRALPLLTIRDFVAALVGRSWNFQPRESLAPTMGSHARWLSRPNSLVVLNGFRTRGRFDGFASVAEQQHSRSTRAYGRSRSA